MIIYRKQKKYVEELQVITKGIKTLEEFYAKQLTKKANNASIKRLSFGLMKASGLTDKKGNALYAPEPIPAWKKRKVIVESKLK